MEKKALGKGLSALIPEKKETSNQDAKVMSIRTDEIKDNSFQPRTNYDGDKLNELKASIEREGVLQPILVREKEGGYEVIAGERRLRAARALNLEEVPVIVKAVTDQEALVIALVENIQREELNPIEEAEAYRKLIEEFDLTQDAVAQSVGKDRSTVSNLLRLLKLPDYIRQGVYEGKLTYGHARTLLSADSTAEQKRLYGIILKKGISVRELENLIKASSTGGYRRERTEAPPNPQLLAIEDGLQKLLGTKVRIDASKKRGKIIIDYYSNSDLDRIVKVIIK